MLSSVHDVRYAPFFRGQGVIQRRHFHEVRTRRGNQVDSLRLQVCYCLLELYARSLSDRARPDEGLCDLGIGPWLTPKVTPELT